MRKIIKFLFIFLALLFVCPNNCYALSDSYVDNINDILKEEVNENKINIYFFYGDGCPHCEKEEVFLNELLEKYSEHINIYRYETWYNSSNKQKMLECKEKLGENNGVSVPFTVVGSEKYSGYNEYVGKKIESALVEYLEIDDPTVKVVDKNKEEIPFLGEVNIKDVSIGLVAVILGFVDGFNPCAMWVLLFLINMLFDMNNRKRMLILGLTFLLVSGFVYFLSMMGITTILEVIEIKYIRGAIGLVALVIGFFNIKKYIDTRDKDEGCHVVDAKKRKKIFTRIKKFTEEKSIVLALVGVSILAVSVNAVELACSAVFPATFAEILAVNNVTGLLKIFYLIIYTIFYMLDDMVVFIIAVCTLSIKTASSKYGKYSSVIGGIIMIVMGILLILKPDWLMFNF